MDDLKIKIILEFKSSLEYMRPCFKKKRKKRKEKKRRKEERKEKKRVGYNKKASPGSLEFQVNFQTCHDPQPRLSLLLTWLRIWRTPGSLQA